MLKPVLAAVALIITAAEVHATDLPAYPFVHVNGSAYITVQPNVGEIDFELVSINPDPEAAWKEVADRLAETKALLAQHGVAGEDISVQDIARRLRKQEVPTDPAPVETRSSVHLTVRDMSKWALIVEPLLKMQNVDAFGIVFNHTDRVKIEADLVLEALADAKRKAANAAQGVGRKLGPANAVALSALKNLSNSFGMASEASYQRGARPNADSVDYSLVAALKLVQGVDVIYRFK